MNTATTYYQTNLETDITYLKGVGPQRGSALKKYGIENDVVITSFWKEWVEETKSYSPEIKTGWLVPLGPGSQWNDRLVDEAIEAEFNQLCPRAELITPTLVNKIKTEESLILSNTL